MIAQTLRQDYNLASDMRDVLFCFDKQVFLDYQQIGNLNRIHYINPGHALFDSLLKVVRLNFKEDMLKGTILVSALDQHAHLAFFVKSQIVDSLPHRGVDSVADEQLVLIQGQSATDFAITSAAKLLDLHPPTAFAKAVDPPESVAQDPVIDWAFEHITLPQYQDTLRRVGADAEQRKAYLEEAFTQIIVELTGEINTLQGKLLLGDAKGNDKIEKKQQRIQELLHKKKDRLEKLALRQQLNMKPPEVLGCAYVVPLSQVEYHQHYGMSRDDEVEAIAMGVAMDYERGQGWEPVDVSSENAGYDIRSTSPEYLKRYIEVKGRSADGGVMLSENEMNRLSQLGHSAWLYVVFDCKSQPRLLRFQNPAQTLTFEKHTKGVQYFVAFEKLKQTIQEDNV